MGYHLVVILMINVGKDMQSEPCLIKQCRRKGVNLIALVPSDDLDQSLVYGRVCDLHYDELMSGYYEKSFRLQEKLLSQHS
jgi:hypothetical protein